MRRLRAFCLRLCATFSRSRRERELKEEFESHLELRIADNIRSGMTPEAARRSALLESGGLEQASESYRDRQRLPALEAFWNDLRYAVRSLCQSPGFTVVAVTTLAVGIGANTAIFTIVNAAMIESLPFRNADRLMVMWELSPQNPDRPNVVGPANFMRWSERAQSFEQMAGFYETVANLTGDGEPEQVIGQRVTANFFSTIGVEPMLGRAFATDEGEDGKNAVIVLGNGIWKRRFGADPAVIGHTIQLNGRSCTIIGVMPPDVGLFIKAGSIVGKPSELWAPFAFDAEDRQSKSRYMTAIARLKPGVSRDKAQAEMDTISTDTQKEMPQFDSGWTIRLSGLRDELSREVRPALLILSGAVGFVLLIACANVANLLLVRGNARRREIAIRTALGAARSRVFRQLLTESVFLAAVAGGAGLALGLVLLRVLVSISPIDVTRLGHIGLNPTVLGFATVISFLTAAVCGFLPAFESARVDVQDSLKDGGKQGGQGARSRRLFQAFVIGQVAIAVILLAGAGVMLRSFSNLLDVDPGFDTSNVLTFHLALPGSKYDKPDKVLQFYRQAKQMIRTLPGVRDVGIVSFLPLSGLGAATDYRVIGQSEPDPGRRPVVDMRVVDDGYFEAMKIPLRQGRFFSEREMTEKSAPVAIINETMARQLGGGAIGQRVMFAYGSVELAHSPFEIIGVVGDVKHADLTTTPRAMAYWPHPLVPISFMTMTVRTASNSMSLVSAVTRNIQSVDKDLPLSDVLTMDQWVSKSIAQSRFNSTVLAAFGVLALLLAAIGIYGVMSYSVRLRSGELAVRVALGADRRTILRMVVSDGMKLVAVGLVVGVPLALALNRSLTGLLYHTAGSDPAVFSAATTVLLGAAILASYLPARGASRTAPVDALRRQ